MWSYQFQQKVVNSDVLYIAIEKYFKILNHSNFTIIFWYLLSNVKWNFKHIQDIHILLSDKKVPQLYKSQTGNKTMSTKSSILHLSCIESSLKTTVFLSKSSSIKSNYFLVSIYNVIYKLSTINFGWLGPSSLDILWKPDPNQIQVTMLRSKARVVEGRHISLHTATYFQAPK